MRIVFFGTPEIAVPTLAAVAAHHDIAGIVCQPDKPQGRSKKPVHPAVKTWALEHGFGVHQPAKLNDGTFEAWLKAQAPELCVVAAYGRWLKQPLLDVPPRGYINMHPSLLPRHRGPAPVHNAILEGDSETGVTIMRVVLEMDAGDILLQESTPLGMEETAGELGQRLGVMGGSLMLDAIQRLESGTLQARPQNPECVTHSRMLEKQHGRVQWERSAVEIHRQVCAMNPWPLAQCLYQGQICLIHRSFPLEEPTVAAPGTITRVAKDDVWVATGHGQLALRVFQAPGKKALPMGDFLRGRPMREGETLDVIADEAR